MKYSLISIVLWFIAFSCFAEKEFDQVSLDYFQSEYKISDIGSVHIIDSYDIRCKIKGRPVPLRFFRSNFVTDGDYLRFIDELGRTNRDIITSESNGFGILTDWGFPLLIFIVYLITLSISIIKLTKKKFEEKMNKIVWLLIIFIFPLLGSILFLFFGKKQK